MTVLGRGGLDQFPNPVGSGKPRCNPGLVDIVSLGGIVCKPIPDRPVFPQPLGTQTPPPCGPDNKISPGFTTCTKGIAPDPAGNCAADKTKAADGLCYPPHIVIPASVTSPPPLVSTPTPTPVPTPEALKVPNTCPPGTTGTPPNCIPEETPPTTLPTCEPGQTEGCIGPVTTPEPRPGTDQPALPCDNEGNPPGCTPQGQDISALASALLSPTPTPTPTPDTGLDPFKDPTQPTGVETPAPPCEGEECPLPSVAGEPPAPDAKTQLPPVIFGGSPVSGPPADPSNPLAPVQSPVPTQDPLANVLGASQGVVPPPGQELTSEEGEGEAEEEEVCDDEIDNDGDGLIDLLDPECVEEEDEQDEGPDESSECNENPWEIAGCDPSGDNGDGNEDDGDSYEESFESDEDDGDSYEESFE